MTSPGTSITSARAGGDLGAFFIFWGECQVDDCLADFNDDEVVDGIDLGILFSAWGPCT